MPEQQDESIEKAPQSEVDAIFEGMDDASLMAFCKKAMNEGTEKAVRDASISAPGWTANELTDLAGAILEGRG